jgi:hypothetical protein
MLPGLSENLNHEFARSIKDFRLIEKAGVRMHKAVQPYYPLDAIERTQVCFELCQDIDRA